jgi:competence ComEA-like helix-hairpin-helix protein
MVPALTSLKFKLKTGTMNWKNFVTDYLNFSRRERIAAIVIVVLIFFIWLSPRLLQKFRSTESNSARSLLASIKKLDSLKSRNEKNKRKEDEDEPDYTAVEKAPEPYSPALFYFDPNLATNEEWKKLGLGEKTIRIIKNYLAHGGHFKNAEDLKKIYGLNKDQYSRLEPYVKIQINEVNAYFKTAESPKPPFEKKLSKFSIDINLADTTEFISLPGIGSKLAARIVNFRDKLGGFYSVDQVGETYGLPDSTFQKIKTSLFLADVSVKMININSATKDELKLHPYIRWVIANAIVEYRNQHGNFSSPDDLKKISVITDDVFEKIKRYLTVN